ncbi:hypothetical protein Dcar01_01686 [Deinococcus carri]|uniref:Translation initiation factor IF-2 n=1 Tax=Deinococcus carri TaxID=1211323 RepID=A0ABP9W9U0_9DEIO
MKRNSKRAPLIALAAALPLTAGLVFAAGTSATPQRVQPAQPGQQAPGTAGGPAGQTAPQRSQSGTNYEGVFLQKLAAQLGISVERLRAAAVAAGSATIDQEVRAGDIPSDRAAGMKGRLQQNPLGFGGRGGHGPRGHHRGGQDGPRGFDRPGDSSGNGAGTGTFGSDTSGT